MNSYEQAVRERGFFRYILGLIIRWRNNIRYENARRCARRNGATIGRGVIMPLSLAKKMNKNCIIGDHVSIQTEKIDTRAPLSIGNNVIIGSGVEILTCSHNIDSTEWELKVYGLTIHDYVWVPTNVLILPSCRSIGKGAVIGAGSVVAKNIEPMSVVAGNPARVLRKRTCVHSDLVVESLLGGDFYIYKSKRRK